jgi:hypothetical protein
MADTALGHTFSATHGVPLSPFVAATKGAGNILLILSTAALSYVSAYFCLPHGLLTPI